MRSWTNTIAMKLTNQLFFYDYLRKYFTKIINYIFNEFKSKQSADEIENNLSIKTFITFRLKFGQAYHKKYKLI